MGLDPKKRKERYNTLKAQRATMESHWQDLADYLLPNKNDITQKTFEGDKRNLQIFDNTGPQSNETLAGALHGLLTNPFAQWFELTSGDPELDNNDNVRLWFQDTSKKMHSAINDSNFQTEIHETYLDLGCFGTNALLCEEDPKTLFRFCSTHIGDVYIAENNKGIVDEVMRDFEWTAKLIVAEFGTENLPSIIQKAYDNGSNEKFKIVHHVYANDERSKKEAPEYSQFEFVSVYGLLDHDLNISVKGFHEMPYIVSRWSKVSGEVYGRSPGMTSLPEVRTINLMTQTLLEGAALALQPPLQMPDDGFIMPLDITPGGINYYRSGSQDRVEAVFTQNTNMSLDQQIMEPIRQRIRQAFFVDQFQLGTGPQMTATEVNQRTDEKMRLLSPMLGRQQSELLAPLISRIYGIMTRRGALAPAPRELVQKGGFGVRYSSLIAKAQRASEGDGIVRTLQAVGPFIQMDPAVADIFDGDASAVEIAKMYGFPQRMIRRKDKIRDIRESRAAAQQKAISQQDSMADAEMMNKAAPMLKPQG